ncbi:hypothetical protein ACFYW6_07210 [Streptomyces sp. NPDC002659]|uniref:hypothetical protein n=1 Tax=Streptomyces sp. NPDC002659 TaxID=3364656 RepID=UPI0036B94BAC
MNTQTTHRATDVPFSEWMARIERNRLSVETEHCVYSLPRGARMEPGYGAVRILTTNADDLAVWLEVRGGTISATQAGDGVQVWTLRTATEAELPKYPAVTVLVSVLVTGDEQMMPELLAAVAR